MNPPLPHPRTLPCPRPLRTVLLLALSLLLLFPGPLPAAGKRARKTVRVAYQEFNRQMIVDENNRPVSGYAYDYILTLATYAGWNVEFVPSSSFLDAYEKLLAGEVDLNYEISYTEERAREILFPVEPMGFEYYYLYSSADNASIAPDDLSSLQGKTVGVTRGTMLGDLLRGWCASNNVQLDIVEYEDISLKEADLLAGKIDLDLELSMLAKRHLSAIKKIGSSSYYLVANKNRPDLIADINAAMDKVLGNDIFFFSQLQERYFADTVLSRNLTADEKQWIADHKTLRIGFFDRYLPFSAQDADGRPVGSGIDAIREILRRLKLEDALDVEFVCYHDQREGYKAVESGEIDMMFPAYISSSVQQDYRIIGSRSIATLTCDLAFRNGSRNDAPKRLGVNRDNLMQVYYTKDCLPGAELVPYADIQGCLDGLMDGTSDGTFLNGLRSEALMKPVKYHSLSTVRSSADIQLRMAFAEDNLGLMLLMDRGLALLDADFVNKASYSYMDNICKLSLLDSIQEHFLPAVLGVAVLAALLVAIVATRLRNRELSGINRTLEDNFETIEKQREQEQTLRKELEKKQVELKDALHMAQAANAAKTTFLNSMSHDIRTPMNAIIGFTGLAASHLDEKERVSEYLKTIAQSSEHLLSLINDVLDMSRIEAGKMSLREREESLADILHTLRNIVQADVRAKQHNFFIDTVDVRHELVCCDKMRLNQVLFNLVSNAIKYTPAGGTISLRIVEKSVSESGRATFEFRCKDNGIGMDAEFAKTVFDPFTREQDSTVSGVQGTGLGMSIAKNIVEMMGGTISVRTRKGEGTEVVVTVDFALAAGNPSDPVIPGLKGLRSLVVDDDMNACQSIADMLRSAGMRSEWCVSGKEAVVRTEESLRHGDRFKVYVVDWLMPDMNGIETVRRIRKVVGKDASIVILTAYDWTGVETEAREAGVDDFIAKPLFPSDLQRVLRRFCGGETPAPDASREPAISLEGKRILMADDSPLNLKIGTILLREHGMVVDTAENGRLAVEKVRENGAAAYDVVLMDVQMPVMDGYEATAEIRKLPGGDKLEIIAFSANAFEEDKEKSRQAGMDGHLTKPLEIRQFLQELQRFASHS